jgi:hypothetical protein
VAVIVGDDTLENRRHLRPGGTVGYDPTRAGRTSYASGLGMEVKQCSAVVTSNNGSPDLHEPGRVDSRTRTSIASAT